MLNREILFLAQKNIDGDIKSVIECFCWLFCRGGKTTFFIENFVKNMLQYVTISSMIVIYKYITNFKKGMSK